MRKAFLNGEILPLTQASLPLNDLGLTRGYGVCEVLRSYNRLPHLAEQHLARLQRSCLKVNLVLPYSAEKLLEAIHTLIAQNVSGEASIKIVVTGGPTADGISYEPAHTRVYITVEPFIPLPNTFYEEGVFLTLNEHQRQLPEVKTLNYLHAVANQSVKQAAGAFELLYHSKGELRESSTSNVMLIKGDSLITPNQEILFGITRGVVLELAKPHYRVEERTVLLSELGSAEEVFLTATNKDVLPVVRIGERHIGKGIVGPKTQHLLKLYRKSTILARSGAPAPSADQSG